MLKRTNRDYRSTASGDSSFSSDLLDQVPRPAGNTANNVVPFCHNPNLQHGRPIDWADSLAELEAENAMLRDSAIELALEIQDLRERRSRAHLDNTDGLLSVPGALEVTL
jgi:hypothetical protein